MAISPLTRPAEETPGDNGTVGGKITVFHCANAVARDAISEFGDNVTGISLPCSSMAREVVFLKAFESGADAVVVLACPEKTCHYLEGNLRAKKRVARVKMLLDEAGLDGRRLNFYNVSPDDGSAVRSIIRETAAEMAGPVPGAVK